MTDLPRSAFQAARETARTEPVITRVSTLELFLDLVFVFTVTQLTSLIVGARNGADYLKAALVFMTIWWIYSGYVWLTSNVGTERTKHRLLMFAGMAGFLVMALAIPTVFDAGGVAYGVGLLVVTLVHAGLFTQARTGSARAILGIAPFNLVSAGLVLLAGFVNPPWDWPLWVAAVGVVISSSFFGRERGFTLSPAHFVERHGLVVLIALGESIVAIGTGARGLALNATLVTAAALGLALAGALWWTYFDRDDQRAERRMDALPDGERARLALAGFGYGHYLMLAGIIVLAAGIKGVVAHPADHAEPHVAWCLGGGLALYLAGDVLFRRLMGLGPGRLRLLAAVGALLTVPLALAAGGLVQLGACVALLVLLLLAEAGRRTVKLT